MKARKIRNAAAAVVLGSALMAWADATHASGIPVIDAASLAQHVQNVMQSVKNYQQMLTDYQNQIMQYQVAYQQLKAMDPNAIARLVGMSQQEIYNLRSAVNSVNSLYGSVGEVKEMFEGKFNAARLAHLDFDSYLKWEKEAVANGVDSVVKRAEVERNLLKRVENDYELVQEWQAKIPHTEGTHQAMQMMNQQMNRMVAQNADLLRSMAQTTLEQQNEKMEKLAAEKAREELLASNATKVNAETAAAMSVLNQLRYKRTVDEQAP